MVQMTTLAQRGTPLSGAAFASPCYRIPALAVTDSARIVVAYDVRADHLDLPGEFDIVTRTSSDGGLTWSEPGFLRRHEPGHGFGDASLIFDPATGRLWCWYVGSAGPSFWDDEGLELWLAHSDDEGETWTHRPMTFACAALGGGVMFASSGNGIALSSGRLVQPMVFRPSGTTDRHAVMAYSDDHGEDWRLGEPVRDCDENKVVELRDGRLLLHARATPHRKQAYSSDGGVTFTEPMPHTDLRDPSCNGGLASLSDGTVVCTLLDPPETPIDPSLDPTRGQGSGLAWGQRSNLVLRLSSDDGMTWTRHDVVDPGPAAYSVALPIAADRLGIVYEAGIYERVVFASLSVCQNQG